jgi:uncharacterized protein GlcG (DUF336 family)
MPVTPNTTTTAQINVTAREIDFVSRFTSNVEALMEILGIMRPIRKAPGTVLRSYKTSVVLQNGEVAEGDEVPLSQASVEEVAHKDIVLKKHRKRVTAEAVNKYGAVVAVQKTDDALLNEIQGEIMDDFYAFALTGTLKENFDSFQMAVAMATAMVKDKFKKMHLNYGQVVVFVNTLDVGRYQGAAAITVQSKAGIDYVKDFVGVDTMIVSSEIPEGTVVAIPVENIDLYYVDPSDGDFTALGLIYTTGNEESNLIGVHKEGVYGNVSGDTHTLSGITLWAEYLDGIAVVTFGQGG